MDETDDRVWHIAETIHMVLGQKNPTIKKAWEKALKKRERGLLLYDHDEIGAILRAIRNGDVVYVAGGSGIVRVDPVTGKIVDGANLIGIDRVQL